ncbi:MAG: tetratricopeptide repeat protein, partial [Cyclobacteriaceae bacterium]|nr:tetratricopeptide repeat protein [Cyclobacteriaceae bacterium]
MRLKILLLIVIPLQVLAQNPITDSLHAVLDTARNERKVKTLNELFRAWLPSDPIKAIGYTREALNLATEIGDKRGMAAAYNNLGVAYRNQGALDKALQYYITALHHYEELGNKEGIAGTKSNIATLYSMKKDYGQALKYFDEAHAAFVELNDKPKIIASMNNLGNLNNDMQLYEKAMKYFSEAWQLSLQMGKPFADPLINIGNVYFKQGNYQRAIENYMKALEIERQSNNRLSQLNIFTNIGIAYTKAGQPKAAQPYLEEAEKLARELHAYTGMPELLRSKAINMYRLGNLKSAFELMLKYDSAREQIYGEEINRAISRMELA